MPPTPCIKCVAAQYTEPKSDQNGRKGVPKNDPVRKGYQNESSVFQKQIFKISVAKDIKSYRKDAKMEPKQCQNLSNINAKMVATKTRNNCKNISMCENILNQHIVVEKSRLRKAST